MSAPLVLIVEDEPDFYDLLRALVEDAAPARCVWARSAEEALEMIQCQIPDLILLDLVLPGLDGVALCHLLKASSATRHVPVIVVSGAAWGYEETFQRAQEAGCNSFVHKLYNFHDLETLIPIYLDAGQSAGYLPFVLEHVLHTKNAASFGSRHTP